MLVDEKFKRNALQFQDTGIAFSCLLLFVAQRLADVETQINEIIGLTGCWFGNDCTSLLEGGSPCY